MENRIRKQEFYTSPEVKVVELKARQVICASYNSVPVTMSWGDEQDGDNWEHPTAATR